jgi:microcystin-dependent protein
MPDETPGQRQEQDNRPARETPNYKIPVPGDAGPADYVEDTGRLADRIDELGSMFFPGDYRFSGSRRERPGWLLCDGREVRRDLYPNLFDEIGEDHGAGDGQETFNLPNFLDGRFPMGLPEARLGERGGAGDVVLTVAQMPHHAHNGVTAAADRSLDHLHSVPTGWAPMNMWTAGGDIHQGMFNFAVGGASAGFDRQIDHLHGIVGEGGNQSHTNTPPYIGVNVFIKT